MKRGEPPQRKTPLKQTTSLRRSTPLQQSSEHVQPGARKSSPRRRRSTVDLRAALLRRSDGQCEMALPGCEGQAVDPCHRIGTGMGGTHGEAVALSDRPSNATFCCRRCHDWQHRNVAMAKAYGLILPRHADPLTEPVLLRYGVVFLADDGSWELAPPARANEINEAARRREARSA